MYSCWRNRSLLLSGLAGLSLLGACAAPSRAQNAVTGQWQFNGDNNADVGLPVVPNGTWNFGTDTINGHAAQIASFPVDSSLLVPHGALPNGGGIYVNQFSLMMDVKFATDPGWIALLQTNEGNPNGNDADFYIDPNNGLGISGNYSDTGNALRFTRGVWQRITVVIDTTTPAGDGCVYRCYINGVLQNVVQSPGGWGRDGRFSLDPTLLLFAEGDTSGVYEVPGSINSLQFRNYAMSDLEVNGFGGPRSFGITKIGDCNGDNNVDDADLGLVLFQQGKCAGIDGDFDGDVDVNGDGCIDDADLGLVLAHQGE